MIEENFQKPIEAINKVEGDNLENKVEPFITSKEEDNNITDRWWEHFIKSQSAKPDTAETQNIKGGSYDDIKKQDGREGKEVHHIPADSASKLETKDGPAILMEKEDHKETASYGASKEARIYREKQRILIEEGKFAEAFEMDVEDIQSKFGDKYDDAIAEAKDYVDKLEKEGKI